MSAEIIDLRLERAKAAIGSPADVAWHAFVLALDRAQAWPTMINMRAAVEAHDAMLAAFEAHEKNPRGFRS